MKYDVLVFGSGPSGLTAAHELAERGYKVCVLEKDSFIGGKPVSGFGHPYKAISGKLDKNLYMPMEHAFRVYPENYLNLIDVMKRIPHPEGGNVTDYFTNELHVASNTNNIPENVSFLSMIQSKLEFIFFLLALFIPYSLYEERSLEKYDKIYLSELMEINKRSPQMKQYLQRLAGSAASGNPRIMSSISVINLLLNYYLAPNSSGFRTFKRPTNIAWIYPWIDYLESLKVTFLTSHQVIGFDFDPINSLECPKIKCLKIITPKGIVSMSAKYYISAIPANNVVDLIESNLQMVRYDPRLYSMYKIVTLPATGVQLYYDRPIKELSKQFILMSLTDHPWELTYIDQSTYWDDDYTSDIKGNRKKYGVITIYTAVLNEPGRIIPLTIAECTAEQIAEEMFTEVEREFKKRGIPMGKKNRVGYACHDFQNPTKSKHEFSHLGNDIDDERLHFCVPDMYKVRPKPETVYLRNLILAGAYTQNKTYYVSTMESASESGKRAAQTVLSRLKSKKNKVNIYESVNPPWFIKLLRNFDSFLYSLGLPNPFDLLLDMLRRILWTSNTNMDKSIQNIQDMNSPVITGSLKYPNDSLIGLIIFLFRGLFK
jgi:hypothetical protein